MANMTLSMVVQGRDRASDIFRRIGRGVTGTAKASARLAQGFGVLSRRTRQANQDLTQLNRTTANAERGMSRLKRAAIGIFAGGMLAMGGHQLMRGLQAPLNVAMQYEAAMDKVGAVANIQKSSVAYKELNAQAKQLGENTAFSASQAAEGMQYLAMAGFNPEQIKQTMPGMLDLAKAGDTDLATTADISSNILSGFGMEASEMGKLGDVLTAAFTSSNTNLTMLGDTMKYVAPMAAKAGASIEETAAMAGLLGNVGIQASQAGTSMRAMFTRLAGPPKMAADALSAIGVQTKDAAGNMRKMPDILADVYNSTKHLGNGDQLEIFKRIAGDEAGAAFAELVKQAGTGGLQEYIAKLEHSSGRASQVARQMADNLKGDITALNSAKEGMQITFAELFTPDMRKSTQYLTQIVRGVNDWMKQNPRLAKSLGMVAGVMASLGIAVGVVAIAGPILLAAFSPVLAPVMALAAAAGLIMANWDRVGFYFDTLFLDIKDAFRSALGLAKAIFKGDWTGAKQKFAELKQDLGFLGRTIWGGIEWGAPKVDNLLNLPEGTTLATIQAVWQPISDFFTGFWGGLSATFEPVSESFSSLWVSLGGVKDAFGDLFHSLFGGENSGGLEKFGNIAGELAGTTLKGFANVLSLTADAIAGIVTGITWLSDNTQTAFNWLSGQTRFDKWESAHNEAAKAIDGHVGALKNLTGSRDQAMAAIKEMTQAERDAAMQQATIGIMKAEQSRENILKQLEKEMRGTTGFAEGRGEIFDKINEGTATSADMVGFLNNNTSAGTMREGVRERLTNLAGDLQQNEAQMVNLETAQSRLIEGAKLIKAETQTNVSEANAIVANENWHNEGYKLMTTFAAGISAGSAVAIAEVQKTMTQIDAYNPHSDAKVGPLSRLTASGAALMTTFASGMRQTADAPLQVMRPALEKTNQEFKVVKPKNGRYEDNDGMPPHDATGYAKNNEGQNGQVTQHFTIQITVNEAETDPQELGRMVAAQIAEQARTASNDGGSL